MVSESKCNWSILHRVSFTQFLIFIVERQTGKLEIASLNSSICLTQYESNENLPHSVAKNTDRFQSPLKFKRIIFKDDRSLTLSIGTGQFYKKTQKNT